MATITPTQAREIKYSLIAGDLIAILFILEFVYFNLSGDFGRALSLPSLIYMIFVIIVLASLDLYSSQKHRPLPDTLLRTLVGCGIVGSTLAYKSYLAEAWHIIPLSWRNILLPFLLGFSIWLFTSRAIMAHFSNANKNADYYLVLGDLTHQDAIESDFRKLNLRMKLIDPAEVAICANYAGVAVQECPSALGVLPEPTDHLLDLSSMPQGLAGIVVSPHITLPQEFSSRLMNLRLNGYPVYDLKNFYQYFHGKFPPSLLQDCWFAFSDGFILLSSRSSQVIKRIIDLALSFSILVILLPLLILIAILIKIDSPGSIVYSQWRTGLKGQPFRIYKFRSMTQDAEKHGCQWATVKDPRITRIGNFIRLTRIDELPQLLNVLRGDMSLIGPRPERPEFDRDLEQKIPYYGLRYLVRPGITGWAQVMYPYGASVEDAYEKLSYDLYYIKNYSILLDFKILLKTIQVVFLGKGR
ncbi:MAG: exopolysaccharide biosynthesis polyprenyl glycosylphosphotransferase [Synechococcales bacterium]|nr:exopolysaccharide biosynthesis polyprenyl glycosylphosphotransferase [Synechococcales bacterium]